MRTLIRRMALLLLVIGLFCLTLAGLNIVNAGERQLDPGTIEACRWYGQRDHEKEIAPLRYQKLGREFFDSFDWYSSCIKHHSNPTA